MGCCPSMHLGCECRWSVSFVRVAWELLERERYAEGGCAWASHRRTPRVPDHDACGGSDRNHAAWDTVMDRPHRHLTERVASAAAAPSTAPPEGYGEPEHKKPLLGSQP